MPLLPHMGITIILKLFTLQMFGLSDATSTNVHVVSDQLMRVYGGCSVMYPVELYIMHTVFVKKQSPCFMVKTNDNVCLYRIFIEYFLLHGAYNFI